MDVDEPEVTYLPQQPLPRVQVPASYDAHREKHTPLCIDNGSTHLRFGFCTSESPRMGVNMIAKYKERKTNKPLLLFGDGIDIEGGARSQARTPWEGDVLLNFDALVRAACTLLYDRAEVNGVLCRRTRWTTRSSSLGLTPQL